MRPGGSTWGTETIWWPDFRYRRLNPKSESDMDMLSMSSKLDALKLSAQDKLALNLLAACHQFLLQLSKEKGILIEEITDEMIMESYLK